METSNITKQIINNKYRILNILGAGSIGVTYAAENLETQQKVAIKVLSLERIKNWKALELFEREAKILQQLNHPAIPSYLDYFQIDANNNRAFYLVQELAFGKPLSELIETGWRPQEAEVKDLAKQLLEVLIYLQQLNPAIIHRDIKPQNIIRQADGKIFLVDFGAVQNTYHHTVTGGSTVVGTFGYMAPEQFRGQANITSDLYGLGTTLLFLLTRKDPSELPQKNLKIKFRDRLCLPQDFTDWLDKMLAPAFEDRFESASEALAVLKGAKKLTVFGIKDKKPQVSQVSFKKTKERLIIIIPPALRYSNFCRVLILAIATINYLFLVTAWIAIESNFLNLLLIDELNGKTSYLLVLTIILIINSYLYSIYRSAFGFTYIRIERHRLTIRKWFTDYKIGKIAILENTKDIEEVGIKHLGEPLMKNVLTVCLIKLSSAVVQFGLFLPRKEKKWLLKEIKDFLKNCKISTCDRFE